MPSLKSELIGLGHTIEFTNLIVKGNDLVQLIMAFATLCMVATGVQAGEWEERKALKGLYVYQSDDLHRGESVAIRLPAVGSPGPARRRVVSAMAKAMSLRKADDVLEDNSRLVESIYDLLSAVEALDEETQIFLRKKCLFTAEPGTYKMGFCYFDVIKPSMNVEIWLNTLTLKGGADGVALAFANTSGDRRFHLKDSEKVKTYRDIYVRMNCFTNAKAFAEADTVVRSGGFADDVDGHVKCNKAENAEIAGVRSYTTIPIDVFYDLQGGSLTTLKYPAVTNFSRRDDGNWNAFAIPIADAVRHAYR